MLIGPNSAHAGLVVAAPPCTGPFLMTARLIAAICDCWSAARSSESVRRQKKRVCLKQNSPWLGAQACPHSSVEVRLRPPAIDLWSTHVPLPAEAALLFLLLGAVYLHHLPQVASTAECVLRVPYYMPGKQRSGAFVGSVRCGAPAWLQQSMCNNSGVGVHSGIAFCSSLRSPSTVKSITS